MEKNRVGRPTTDQTFVIKKEILDALKEGRSPWALCGSLARKHRCSRQWVNYLFRQVAPEAPRPKKNLTKQCIACHELKNLSAFTRRQHRCMACVDDHKRRCTICSDLFESEAPKSYCSKCQGQYYKELKIRKEDKGDSLS